MPDRIPCLKEDLAYIEDSLKSFKNNSYSFTKDLQDRMAELYLSDAALGKLCQVSHTTVGKWRKGKARPNGRERFKKLGMALDMDEETLNTFLLQNGYPRLYIKNLQDSAARILLIQRASDPELFPDIVGDYLKLCQLQQQEQERLSTCSDKMLIKTALMSMNLKKAVQIGQVDDWFEEYRRQFRGSGKTELPHSHLARFLFLYFGEKSDFELAVYENLPPVLQHLLYSVYGGKDILVKGLREKLIALGLYANMTNDEIDIMLRWARLRPLSEPSSSLDCAIFEALCCAHYRHSFFEWENLQRNLLRLDRLQDEHDEDEKNKQDMQDEFIKLMQSVYCPRAEQMASYYEQYSETSDKAFEEHYTFCVNRGVRDYVHDLLYALIEEGYLDKGETEDFLDMISRNNLPHSLHFILLRAGLEAENAHVNNPGIELWLLGILKLSELSAKDAFQLPGSDLKIIDEDIAALKKKMDEYGIDPGTLYKNLSNSLKNRANNATNETVKSVDKTADKENGKKVDNRVDIVINKYLKLAYKAAKKGEHKEVWATDLLGALLEEPTDTLKEYLPVNYPKKDKPNDATEAVIRKDGKKNSAPPAELISSQEFDRLCALYQKYYDLDIELDNIFFTPLLN